MARSTKTPIVDLQLMFVTVMELRQFDDV